MKFCSVHKEITAAKTFAILGGNRFADFCIQCAKGLVGQPGLIELTTTTPEKSGQILPTGPVSDENFQAVLDSLAKKGLLK